MNTAPKRTVLLTGSEGFLGKAIQRYTPPNVDLIATDLEPPTQAEHTGSTVFRTLNILEATPDDFRSVDVVIHNAGLFDLTATRETLMSVNVSGTQSIANAAVKAGVKHFIQVSSTSIYGPNIPPIPEDVSPKRPVHHYGESKWLGEQESMNVCAPTQTLWASIRPTLIYGPESRYGMAPFVAALDACVQKGKRPFLPSNGPISHVVHVDDVARAIWHVAEHGLGGPFNVADETPAAFGDILGFIADQLGVDYRSIPVPWRLARVFLNRPSLFRPLLKWVESNMQRPEPTSPDSQLLPIRLDEDWGYFLAADYLFDTRRLAQTGFEYLYPETNNGLIDTIKWYRTHQWL